MCILVNWLCKISPVRCTVGAGNDGAGKVHTSGVRAQEHSPSRVWGAGQTTFVQPPQLLLYRFGVAQRQCFRGACALPSTVEEGKVYI